MLLRIVLCFGGHAAAEYCHAHAEAVHASTWDSLLEQAEQFVDSSCATVELRQRYKLAYWIVSHAKQFEQVYDSCVEGT